MVTHPIRNLTVALIQRARIGPDRFARPFSHDHLRRRRVLAARQRQFVPAMLRLQRPGRGCPPCDRIKPQAWPYDTPLPVGLPRLAEMPGVRPDNTRLPLTRPALPSPAQERTDHKGKIIDFTV